MVTYKQYSVCVMSGLVKYNLKDFFLFVFVDNAEIQTSENFFFYSLQYKVHRFH